MEGQVGNEHQGKYEECSWVKSSKIEGKVRRESIGMRVEGYPI